MLAMVVMILLLSLPYLVMLALYCLERDNRPEDGSPNPRAK